MFSEHVFVVVVLVAAVTAVAQFVKEDGEFPLIEWQEGCNTYDISIQVLPIIKNLLAVPGDVDHCWELCTNSTECGGFASTGSCLLFNINDAFIADHLDDKWMKSYEQATWYSKTCPYDVGASNMVECRDYSHKHDNLYINLNSWAITYTDSSTPELSAGECQSWCTQHTGCRSVAWYHSVNYDYGRCYLYSNTVTELVATGKPGDVLTNTNADYPWITYDRYCGDVPYVRAHPAELTSQAPATPAQTPGSTAAVPGSTTAALGPSGPTPVTDMPIINTVAPPPACEQHLAEVTGTLPITVHLAGKFIILTDPDTSQARRLSVTVCEASVSSSEVQNY